MCGASAVAPAPRFRGWWKRNVPDNGIVWETGEMFFCRDYLSFLQKNGAQGTDWWFAFPQMRAIIASKHRALWYSYIVAFLPMYKAHPAKTGVAKLQGLPASNCLRQPAAEWSTHVFMLPSMIVGYLPIFLGYSPIYLQTLRFKFAGILNCFFLF